MTDDAKQEREGVADNSDTISRKAVIEAIASVLSKGERPFSPQAPLLAAIHAIPSQPQTDAFKAAKRDWEAIEEDDAESVLVDWALKHGDALLFAALRQPPTDALESEIERLRFEAESNYDHGYYDGCTNQIVRHDALREALVDLLNAVCGEKGFAQAVRRDSGRIYPWPALELAEAKALAALEQSK